MAILTAPEHVRQPLTLSLKISSCIHKRLCAAAPKSFVAIRLPADSTILGWSIFLHSCTGPGKVFDARVQFLPASASLVVFRSVTARASPASTAHTLDRVFLFELGFRHTTDARGVEIRLFGLNAAEAAELFPRVSHELALDMMV